MFKRVMIYTMKIKYLSAIAALLILTIPIFSNAQIPFGGNVVKEDKCDEGELLYILTPLQGVMPFMWYRGELPYLMHVIPHVGQNLLGMAGLVPGQCWKGNSLVGAGLPILFHGDSE